MARLDLRDLQGLVVRGYGSLPAACFVLLRVVDGDLARGQLARLLPAITDATRRPDRDRALQVAFTYDGLSKLGLPPELLAAVSSRITNEVKGINRVVYDISSRPPATIEWE